MYTLILLVAVGQLPGDRLPAPGTVGTRQWASSLNELRQQGQEAWLESARAIRERAARESILDEEEQGAAQEQRRAAVEAHVRTLVRERIPALEKQRRQAIGQRDAQQIAKLAGEVKSIQSLAKLRPFKGMEVHKGAVLRTNEVLADARTYWDRFDRFAQSKQNGRPPLTRGTARDLIDAKR